MEGKGANGPSTKSGDPAADWDAFCESLKRVGDVLRRETTPRDDLTLAEGHRFLSRMLRVALESRLEIGDPLRPCLQPMVGPTLQYEGVTSDARYLNGYIDGARNYRVEGTRGAAPLFEIGVYTGKQGLFDPAHLIASITEETLEVGDDGRVEVAIGPDPRPGNWIQTDSTARFMMIRQYAPDWQRREEGLFTIEELSGEGRDRQPSMESIRDGLEAASDFVLNASRFWAGLSDYWADFSPNAFVAELDADARTDVAPPSGHHFSCGYFQVEPDEALVIRFDPEDAGGATFWSLGVANYWYETIGYGDPDSHLNSGRATYEADGSVRVVISQRRPGVANWLDSKGHREGTMVFRWSRSKARVPAFDCELVKLAELPELRA